MLFLVVGVRKLPDWVKLVLWQGRKGCFPIKLRKAISPLKLLDSPDEKRRGLGQVKTPEEEFPGTALHLGQLGRYAAQFGGKPIQVGDA
jgi:hypothetical protein